VRFLCQHLGVGKSSYYKWLSNPIGKREQQTQQLDDLIKCIFYEHCCRYGAQRIFVELKCRGISCTRERVSSRMKKMNLVAKARRKFKVTTDSNHKYPVANNLLQQNFTATTPNEKWLTDITYIRTQEGWIYLCVFLDLYSRSVIGWSMSKRLKSALVEDALTMALFRRGFPKNAIVHSDRGSQYCSNPYQKLIEQYGLKCSTSAAGCCYDNGVPRTYESSKSAF